MTIHLDADIYDNVKHGTKNVEVRVNDEKRRKLHVGDKLIFLKRPEEIEKIEATVTSLDYYKNFQELVKHYDIERLYLKEYTKDMFLDLLSQFYSEEEQKEYGVVAIGFKIL